MPHDLKEQWYSFCNASAYQLVVILKDITKSITLAKMRA